MIQFLHMKRYQDTKQTRPLMQAKTNNVECLQYVQSHHMMQSTFFVLKNTVYVFNYRLATQKSMLHNCISASLVKPFVDDSSLH